MVTPRIGIITALPKECWAMRAFLDSWKEVYVDGRGAGRRYYVGTIPARDGGSHTVALCHSGVGNNNAAIRASLMLQHFQSVKIVIMVGIAGGVPNAAKVDEHVRLGDIVVSSEGGVTQYDLGKEIATIVEGESIVEFTEKNPPRAPDPILIEAISHLDVDEHDGYRPWIEHIENLCQRSKTPRPSATTDILYSSEDPRVVIEHPHDPSRVDGQPRVFSGKIGSANIVLKNPTKRDYLRDKFDVRAIEMEGSGVADASWKMEVGYLVVRGICDYCDSKKNNDWQKYAAIVAAGYVRALIESIRTSVDHIESDDDHGGRHNASVSDYLQAVKAFAETDTYVTLPEHSGMTEVPLLLRRRNPQTEVEKRPMVLSALLDEKENEPFVMFIAGGGAGKSTLLRRIARNAWHSPEALGLQKRYIPMIIRLSSLATTEHIVVEERLKDAIYKAGELPLVGDLPNGFFSDWPKQLEASWFLLFDGLDEVSSDQQSSLITQLLPLLVILRQNGNRMALTSRPGDFSMQLESKLTPYILLGFTSQQQKQFAHECFGADAAEFLRQIGNLEADEFGGNPLLFTIAAVVFRRDQQLKSNALLYERFIQIWLAEAAVHGLKDQLGNDLYDLIERVLEELAFKMTEQPGEGSSVVLSRKLGLYLKDKLGIPLPKALAQGKILVDVLGIRSGVFTKVGEVCDWAHGKFREYLAGRSMDTQLLESGNDYVKALGNRPFDNNWVEAVSALVQINDKPSDAVNWIAAQAMGREDIQSSLLVHHYWTLSRNQDDPESCGRVVKALLAGVIDPQAGLRGPQMIKDAIVEMGSRAVPALLSELRSLNGLQKELFPGWKGKKPPDGSTDSGKRLHKGYRQRQRIVEVLGEIKDDRSFDELIALLFDDEDDSNRFYMRQTAKNSLTCIGQNAVPPLLKLIEDSSHSTENRRQALVALKSIGRRIDQVSATLELCLREGLSGNHELLKWVLFAATGLRDERQSALVTESLNVNDQEIVRGAAEFFSAVPDRNACESLMDALKRWREIQGYPFGGELGVRSLVSALFLTLDPAARRIVRDVIFSSLEGRGLLDPGNALREGENLSIQGLRARILKEAIAELVKWKRPHRSTPLLYLSRLWNSMLRLTQHSVRKRRKNQKQVVPTKKKVGLVDAVGFLGNTWRPDDLNELVRATQKLESVSSDGPGIEVLVSRYLRRTENGSQTGFIDDSALLRTLAKCQVSRFSEHVGRLLQEADWDFQREISDVLWVAGDVAAEEALLSRVNTIRAEHKSGEDPVLELYHVLRALGTCGTKRGAEMVVDTVLWNYRLDIDLSKDVLAVLLRRNMLDPDRLVFLAEDGETHQYARNFFIDALGYFDASAYGDFFGRMLAHEEEETRIKAAYCLGYSDGSNAIPLLRELLKTTKSAAVAETAAGSLGRLKDSGAAAEILMSIERFSPAQRAGLIREAARLQDNSVVKYLKDTTRSNEWTGSERGDLLAAVGEFYDEAWAQTIVEEWLENTRIGFDTGQQRWAFSVLAQHDPDGLLRHARRLYDENDLEDSARSRLVVLLARLLRSGTYNFSLLLPLLKRLLCDQDLWMRESIAEDLIYLTPAGSNLSNPCTGMADIH
jgi:nucleoside phosphorylase/HEAT repeat protein